jgi:hypothetical protein
MDVVVTQNGPYPPGPLPRWASHTECVSEPRGIMTLVSSVESELSERLAGRVGSRPIHEVLDGTSRND